MLGSLARKLRVFGFDTVYFRIGPDSNLRKIASEERRIILTADRSLWREANSSKLDALLLEGQNDRERLRSLVEKASKASIRLKPGETRCAVCNGSLLIVRRADVSSRIPRGVFRRHRLYYECTQCGRLFWKGKHWSRLRRLSYILR